MLWFWKHFRQKIGAVLLNISIVKARIDHNTDFLKENANESAEIGENETSKCRIKISAVHT
jgi:hypothetical protein